MKNYIYDFIVFIGRFQPFHNAHLSTVVDALKISKHVIIIVGSHKRSRSIVNPWDFETRKQLILKSIPKELRDRVVIHPIRDTMYNYLQWVSNVQGIVSGHINEYWHADSEPKIALTGHFKDDSSGYLNSFPQWDFVPNKKSSNIRRENYNFSSLIHFAFL